MSNTAEHKDWENEAPTLAKIVKGNPFTVAPNYFENLTGCIKQNVFLESLKDDQNAGFTVKEGYFENLSAQINAQIVIANHTQDGAGFSVPKLYFENLNTATFNKVSAKNKTVKLWNNPIFKYAVAASLTIIATSGFFVNKSYQNRQLRSIELAKEQFLFDIDENVIFEYLEEDQSNKTASNAEDMEHYILENLSNTDLSTHL